MQHSQQQQQQTHTLSFCSWPTFMGHHVLGQVLHGSRKIFWDCWNGIFLQSWMPFMTPNQQCQSIEIKTKTTATKLIL